MSFFLTCWKARNLLDGSRMERRRSRKVHCRMSPAEPGVNWRQDFCAEPGYFRTAKCSGSVTKGIGKSGFAYAEPHPLAGAFVTARLGCNTVASASAAKVLSARGIVAKCAMEDVSAPIVSTRSTAGT